MLEIHCKSQFEKQKFSVKVWLPEYKQRKKWYSEQFRNYIVRNRRLDKNAKKELAHYQSEFNEVIEGLDVFQLFSELPYFSIHSPSYTPNSSYFAMIQ